MTRFWWVRHGPTHEKAFTGWRDVPADLSDTAAVARLSAFLPEDALIVASDLVRASATADALMANRTRLPDTSALREFHFGEWDGKLAGEVAIAYPNLSRAYWETPGDVAPPNGESWNAAAARAEAKVAQLCADHQGRNIIAVAHIGIILTRLQTALGVPPAEVLGQKIENLSVTCLCHGDHGWRAELINHLA